VFVFGCLQGEVVTEPPGLLVGVGVAAHIDEQRGEVDRLPIGIIEIYQVGQAKRDAALS
jgi:hypothetical protein